MNTKSPKELAFLHDLYIATDWGERFAELVDDHIELSKEGQVLYIAAGTSGHAMALQERAGEKLEIIAVDENEECLELARAKATALHEQTKFQRENPAALSFADDRFDLVLGNASFAQPTELSRHLAEMVRVARPGAMVAWWLPTASSFGEFFSCGCVLQDRTLFQGISLMPGGSAWTFCRNKPLTKAAYFKPERWEQQPHPCHQC